MTGQVLCGDLGGTWCRTALVEVSPDRLELLPDSFARWKSKDEADIRVVLDHTARKTLDADQARHASYVCFAVAGPVERHQIVRTAPNIRCLHGEAVEPYRTGSAIDLAACLQQLLEPTPYPEGYVPVTVAVVNDLEAALAGEVAKGALCGCRWAFMENIGTGWGGAMLYNGAEVAAEPGHLWVPGGHTPGPCGCGRVDCAEAYFSGGAVRERVRRYCGLHQIPIPDGQDPCAFADEQARAGTPWAVDLYRQVARGIGEIWGSRLNLCPLMEKIAYMGTFAEHAMGIPFFRDAVREAMLSRTLFPDQHQEIEITASRVPRHRSADEVEESLGALFGAAQIFARLHP